MSSVRRRLVFLSLNSPEGDWIDYVPKSSIRWADKWPAHCPRLESVRRSVHSNYFAIKREAISEITDGIQYSTPPSVWRVCFPFFCDSLASCCVPTGNFIFLVHVRWKSRMRWAHKKYLNQSNVLLCEECWWCVLVGDIAPSRFVTIFFVCVSARTIRHHQ